MVPAFLIAAHANLPRRQVKLEERREPQSEGLRGLPVMVPAFLIAAHANLPRRQVKLEERREPQSKGCEALQAMPWRWREEMRGCQ